MKTLPAFARATPQLDDDQSVPDDLVGRLYHASEHEIAEIVSTFSSRQRANLAMFCYRKAHLQGIGLVIAAGCELADLVDAWGAPAGEALFAHGRGRRAPPVPVTSRRPKITLAAKSAFGWTPPAEDLDEDGSTERASAA
jgi:hypothetical protein